MTKKKTVTNLLEFGIILACGVVSITGFVGTQTTQAYDLTQIKFCPKSASGRKGQMIINKEYCIKPRYVLTEEWKKYGMYGSKIPYKGNSLQEVMTLPTDNPNQLLAGSFAVAGLWGAALTMYFRLQRLNEVDYQMNEQEKTYGYGTWEDNKHYRETKAHSRALYTDRLKDGLTAQDTEERIHLGLTDPENEQVKARLQLEDYLKNREIAHSDADKKIAENLKDKSKADKERLDLEKVEETVMQIQDKKSSSGKIQLAQKYQWIYQLLKMPFKVLSGEQGSGKSTLERLALDLLREMGHHIVVINPETIRKGADATETMAGVTVLSDAESINEFMGNFPKSIRDRQNEARQKEIDEDDYLKSLENKTGLSGRVAIILCEANTYEAHDVNPEVWATFLKQMTTNIRKWGYTGVLTAHSMNQTSISSKLAGFSKLIDSCPRIDCISTTDSNGETVGSGKGILKMKGKNDESPLEVDLLHYKPPSKEY
jgi:hypothetical protein